MVFSAGLLVSSLQAGERADQLLAFGGGNRPGNLRGALGDLCCLAAAHSPCCCGNHSLFTKMSRGPQDRAATPWTELPQPARSPGLSPNRHIPNKVVGDVFCPRGHTLGPDCLCPLSPYPRSLSWLWQRRLQPQCARMGRMGNLAWYRHTFQLWF